MQGKCQQLPRRLTRANPTAAWLTRDGEGAVAAAAGQGAGKSLIIGHAHDGRLWAELFGIQQHGVCGREAGC